MIQGDPNGISLDTSITFALELSTGTKVVEVPAGVPNPDPTHCPGSPGAPSAAPGYLCLYDMLAYNVKQVIPGEYLQVHDIGLHIGQASPFGAFLVAGPDSAGVAQGYIDISGSWAVTAP
jgi:hypothetical protein